MIVTERSSFEVVSIFVCDWNFSLRERGDFRVGFTVRDGYERFAREVKSESRRRPQRAAQEERARRRTVDAEKIRESAGRAPPCLNQMNHSCVYYTRDRRPPG